MLLTYANLATLPANGARILAVETMSGKSHWNFMSGVLRPLVDSGHTVTAFTPFPDGDRENYTEVDISGDMSRFQDKDLKGVIVNWSDPIRTIDFIASLSKKKCDIMYANNRMIEVMRQNGNSHFDLVIIEPIMSECVSYLATLLDVPMIYAIPLSITSLMERYNTGHFPNPVIDSHVMSAYGMPTTFVQRLANAALIVYGLVSTEFTASRVKCTNPRPYDLVPLYKPSLVFVNGHPVMTAPSPGVASVVNVGGIHLTVAKSLPKVRNVNNIVYR
jgi:glucuronosyltransferase